MGYRSIVILVINNVHTLPTTIPNGEPNECLDWCSKTTHHDWTCYKWEFIKWYDSYPEIAAIMNFLNNLPKQDYYLAILGEELGDFETKGSADQREDFPYYIFPQQTIIIEYAR